MRRLRRRTIVSVVAALLLSPIVWFLVLVWWQSGAPRGRFTARYDLRRGRYEVLSYGLPVGWFTNYQDILRSRYDVTVHPSIGCVVFRSEREYIDAYNEVSTSAANRKFGHDVFKEAELEASRKWQEEHAAELQPVSHSE